MNLALAKWPWRVTTPKTVCEDFLRQQVLRIQRIVRIKSGVISCAKGVSRSAKEREARSSIVNLVDTITIEAKSQISEPRRVLTHLKRGFGGITASTVSYALGQVPVWFLKT
ncbi:MAG TPA: hypothetical protein DCL48_08660 [Alphaproteobacteria bacterium]|nr:hypothetical protein [Alphaproteobacteria bacterium]